MKPGDPEGIARELNILLGWARAHVDLTTNQGQFSFPHNWGHGMSARTVRAPATLMQYLKQLGYLRRVGGPNRQPVWWVKPDGNVTVTELTELKRQQQLARADAQDPSELARKVVALEERVKYLEGVLRELANTASDAVKP